MLGSRPMAATGVVGQRGAHRSDVGSVARRAVDAALGLSLSGTVRLRAIARPFVLGIGIVARWWGLSRRTLERGCIVPWMLHGGARLWFATRESDTCRLGWYAAGRAHDVPNAWDAYGTD